MHESRLHTWHLRTWDYLLASGSQSTVAAVLLSFVSFLKYPWVPSREGGSSCSLVLASWGDWPPLPSGVQEAELFSIMWLLYPPMENARAQLSQAEQQSPKDVHILTPELLNMSPYMH